MFIWITNKFEKHQRTFAITFAVLTGASLIGFFTVTGSGSSRENKDLPTIKGKPVDQAAYDRAMNLVLAQYIVLQGREVHRTAENMDRLKQDAILQILMDHKAREMGLRVTDDELVRQIQSLPLLQNKAGRFDPELYHRLVIYLNNHQVNEEMFEEVLRTQLLHTKLQSLVTSAAEATPNAVKLEYEPLHEKLTIDLVTFDMADYSTPVIISNEEVQAFYEQSKESFRTPAKVQVRYATFPIEAEKKNIKLTDEEITDYYERNKLDYPGTNNAPQPLDAVREAVQQSVLKLRAERAASDHATELTVKLVGQDGKINPDFDKLSIAMGATVKTTEFFSASEKVPGIEAGPNFAQIAFSLTDSQPYSDSIPGSNAFYVLDYLASQPSRIPTFAEVKTEATEDVKKLRTYDATVKMAHAKVLLLKKLMDNGKTFAQACTDLELKTTTPPTFTVAEEKPEMPVASRIQQATLSMPTGAVSELIQTRTGGLIFFLHKRQPADPAEFAKDQHQFAQQLLQRDRQGLFNDWLNALVRDEQVDFKFRPRAKADDTDATPAGS